MKYRLILLLAFLSMGNLYAQKKFNHKQTTHKKTDRKKVIIKYGTASFYANKFNGRRTTNDEIYNSEKYTAACNQLPLNTWVKVTNLRNNKSVIVKINDRMHPKNHRLIDMSKIAARKLGFVGRGLTRVKVEVLNNFKL